MIELFSFIQKIFIECEGTGDIKMNQKWILPTNHPAQGGGVAQLINWVKANITVENLKYMYFVLLIPGL